MWSSQAVVYKGMMLPMGNDKIADNLTPNRNTFCKLSEVDFNGIARRVELLATNNNNLKVTDM